MHQHVPRLREASDILSRAHSVPVDTLWWFGISNTHAARLRSSECRFVVYSLVIDGINRTCGANTVLHHIHGGKQTFLRTFVCASRTSVITSNSQGMSDRRSVWFIESYVHTHVHTPVLRTGSFFVWHGQASWDRRV